MASDSGYFNVNQAPLLRQVLTQCRKGRKRQKLVDSTGASLVGGDVLVRALALRQVLRREFLDADEQCVGVLMPPTVAGAVVNLALALDRRTTVNLNYVLSPEGLRQSMELADIRHVITSRKVVDRLGIELDVPVIFLEDVPPLVSRRDKAFAAALGMAAPISLIERTLGLHEVNGSDVFTILFTSGATGEPKGVMLSHDNVRSNCQAVTDRFNVQKEDVLVGILPFFHAFGLTVTLWLPLITDAKVAYHTSPLEPDAIGKITRENQGTILLATPTLLRLYARQIPAEDFTSLTTVAAGAERLPVQIADQFEARFGTRPFEGYGVTETSPAISFNVPASRWNGQGPAPMREGTVGQPIPSVSTRVVSRETGLAVSPGDEGVLWVSGPNVMLGYLNRPELTRKVLRDGWYNTGDVVRIDADGFITITGRESQFSKIAGETIPHLLIEEKIAAIVNTSGEGIQHAAVTAVPDARRGERIVVVHTPMEISTTEIVDRLKSDGLPLLFIPSPDSFVEVETVPMLASGKVDLRKLRSIALQAFDEHGRRLTSSS